MTPLFMQYQGKRNVLHKNPYDIDNIACFIDMYYGSKNIVLHVNDKTYAHVM